jgi:CubicO group peptidase (beta-lactamase class C family)
MPTLMARRNLSGTSSSLVFPAVIAFAQTQQRCGGSFSCGTGLHRGAKGLGFGLGVAVNIDPTVSNGFCSAGEFWWGGAASTLFWVDPVEEVVCVYHTQLMPSDFWPIRTQLRIAVNTSLIDAPPAQHAPSTASVAARL